MSARHQLTRSQKTIAAVIVIGALAITGIGFTGSYQAVRALAERKGFGHFSLILPVGIDAGITVLLALDLLLTWLRIPFPLLRHTAWLLTTATIAFNAAKAWPDPIGVAMHAVIPLLFVITIEAARHAIGRIADITADKHMEGVRTARWLLSPVPTFLMWRRMKLWELRSYEQTVRLEQERLTYQIRLHSRFGRGWRRKAPVESLMPLRLARYGIPLAETAPAGLIAAGITSPPAPSSATEPAAPADDASPEESYLHAFIAFTRQYGGFPTHQQLETVRNGRPLVIDDHHRNPQRPPATPPTDDAHATFPGAPDIATHATPPATDRAPETDDVARTGPDPDGPPASATPLPKDDETDGGSKSGAADTQKPTCNAAATLLTVADVALRTGVEKATVRSWVHRNRLRVALRDANGRPHFDPRDVDQFNQRQPS